MLLRTPPIEDYLDAMGEEEAEKLVDKIIQSNNPLVSFRILGHKCVCQQYLLCRVLSGQMKNWSRD